MKTVIETINQFEVIEVVKKSWTEPQITVMPAVDITLGALGVGGDNGQFT